MSRPDRVYSEMAIGPLEIEGRWTVTGQQIIGKENQCPKIIGDLFEQFPNTDKIALSGSKGNVVYSRIKEEENG